MKHQFWCGPTYGGATNVRLTPRTVLVGRAGPFADGRADTLDAATDSNKVRKYVPWQNYSR